jgi:arylsulfatase A-like enzyme
VKVGRRAVLKSLGAIAASSGFSPGRALETEVSDRNSRPNILVFFTDDHGQWLQQAYGNSEVKTPNMSRIARHGVLMTNAYTTCPVCSPARASFFTGRMPSQHGIHDWLEESKQAYAYPWLKGQTLISELLHDAGYHTGLVGKWHCGEGRRPHPGFDYWFSYWFAQYPHRGQQHFSDNGTYIQAEGYQSPLLTDRAISFLRSHYRDRTVAKKPFFLFVGYTDTHSPHDQMPDELVAQYRNAKFRDIPHEPFSKAHGLALIPVSQNPEKERNKHEEYYAAAASIDREVGRILDELESTGNLQNTAVIYTGDHGLNAGQHGIWEKGNATIPQNFFDESVRVPCAISWPGGGIASNLESNLPVNHCDLFATLLDLAKAAPDPKTGKKINSPGKSYLAQLRGGPLNSWRKSTICEYGNARMIRMDGYKLVLRYPYENVSFPNELYDLKSDPRETVNLYLSQQHSQVVQQLSAEIDKFFSKYTVKGHSGLDLERQPMATPDSPWIKAVKMAKGKMAVSGQK